MEIQRVLDNLSSKLKKSPNHMKKDEVKNAYDTFVSKLKNGTANIDDPLNDLDKAIMRITKKSIKQTFWFKEINEEVKAVCRQNQQQTSMSSNTNLQQQTPPSSSGVAKQKRKQSTAKFISQVSVASDSKGKSGKQPLESSICLLKEVCNMINCQVNDTYTDEGIYQLVVGIKTKINEIESQCVDVSKQVKALQDAFGVQQEGLNGGIKCIPLWKDALGNILRIRKSTKDQSDKDETIGKTSLHAAIHGEVYQHKTDNKGISKEQHKTSGPNHGAASKHHGTKDEHKKSNGITGTERGKQEDNISSLQTDIEDLTNRLEKEKESNLKLKRDSDSMNEQYRQLQKEKENLQKELQNKNEKEQRDSVRDKDKQTTDDRKINYKETSTKKVNEKFVYLETELAQEKDKNKKLRNDIHTKHEEIIKLKDNVDYWKNRVSKLAGSKLTDNNPGVTDLSDPNRPTRLAEMFNEIYDNVWTDTLEGLNQPKQIATEKKAVEHMASILKVCYDYCANKFQDTLIQVEKILLLNVEKNTDEELYKEERKQLKDMLKSAGVRTSKGLNQDEAIKFVQDTKLRKDMETYKGKTEKFTKQCLEICWLMVVQDPKVVLYWGDVKEGSKINSDHFKCFTRSGKLLEYLVWPAMLLHKDGPFLSKGIVQPLATTDTTSTRL